MLLPLLLIVDPFSWIFGEPAVFSQAGNGTLLSVVSRAEGRGARAGALVDMYFPQYAHDQLWEAYVGVSYRGRFAWAHDLRLISQRVVPDGGLIDSRFEGPGFDLVVADLVRPGAAAHVRHVTVLNTGREPLESLSTTFHVHFMLGGDPWGDRLHFDPAAGRLVQVDGDTAAVIATDRPEVGWEAAGLFPVGVAGELRAALGPLAPGASTSATFVIGLGHAVPRPGLAGGTISAAEEAAGGEISAGSADSAISAAADSAILAAAEAAGSALSAGWDALVAEDRDRWAAFLARARLPAALPDDARAAARRALITLGQLQSESGGIVAAPTNLNPPYRFVWPRDSTFVALGLLEAGYEAEAKAALEFLERVQAPDGSWAINFVPDGSRAFWDMGTPGNEHDQAAMLPWGAGRVFAATGDRAWLEARWPAVRRACEFMLRVTRRDGLLSSCRDLWELDAEGTWTYSNGAAVAGLRAGAEIAGVLGHPPEAARFRAGADRLTDAISRLLVAKGRLVQGLGPEGLDEDVESANLALGSSWFQVFADGDPRMARTADAISARLASPGGGIRRYTGDTYYGGQPWPIATGWLALYRLATGDVPEARRLFDVMTRYAQASQTLQLGEQFDESKGGWTGAYPLAWSEATYLTTALRLYSRD